MLKHYFKYAILTTLSFVATIVFLDYAFQKTMGFQDQLTLSKALTSIEQFCASKNEACASHSFEQPIGVISASEFSLPPEASRELEENEYALLENAKSAIAIKKLDSERYLFFRIEEVEHYERYYVVIFYCIILLFVLIWIFPIFSEMNRFRKASKVFAISRDSSAFENTASRFLKPIDDSLQWMIGKISRLIALQNEISATMSHELKTPISRMKFILATMNKENCEEQRRLINEDIDEIESLIGEYLSFAKLEHETPILEIEGADVASVLEEQIKYFQNQSTKKISFINKSETGQLVEFDRKTMTRALKNLTENAVKYANKQILITIEVKCGQVIISFEDDGKGLNAENVEELFLPYSRAKSVSDIQGYGLGLAIVKKILAWHGGEISLAPSKVLCGATFVLSWPIQQSPE